MKSSCHFLFSHSGTQLKTLLDFNSAELKLKLRLPVVVSYRELRTELCHLKLKTVVSVTVVI
jgi:hypothetical protein